MLRKNPNSGANGRKKFNLIWVRKFKQLVTLYVDRLGIT
jgi:hypothetical protein